MGLNKSEILEYGRQAEELMKNELLAKIFKDTESEIFDTWVHSPPEDTEGREYLYMRMEAIRKLKFEIDRYIKNAMIQQVMDNESIGGADE